MSTVPPGNRQLQLSLGIEHAAEQAHVHEVEYEGATMLTLPSSQTLPVCKPLNLAVPGQMPTVEIGNNGEATDPSAPISGGINVNDAPNPKTEDSGDMFEQPHIQALLTSVAGGPVGKRIGFMGTVIFPGESPAEFAEDVASKFQELELDDPLERQLGFTYAWYLWLMDHLEVFDSAQLARAKYGTLVNREEDGSGVEFLIRLLAEMRKHEQLRALDEKMLASAVKELSDIGRQLMARGAEKCNAQKLTRDLSLAELGELVTPERQSAELDIRKKLANLAEGCLRQIERVKGMKKKFKLGSKQVAAPTITIAGPRSSDWGRVRLTTTKRRR